MTTTININGKDVEITLTKEQIAKIKKANIKITDQVKTFKDACELLGIDPADVLHSAHSNYLKKDIKSVNAFMKLTIIARALNEGWEPDWANDQEAKYYPWLKFSPGVGFSYGGYGYGRANSLVGSRLCFKTPELAEYAGKQFKEEYNDFFNL